MPTDAAFVLLADLHFGAGPLKQAELPPLAISGLLRRLGIRGDLERFFVGRCAAHDLAILKMLPRYLNRLVLQLKAKEDFPGYEFDLTLLLGDLATWPSAETYEFVRDYLSGAGVRITSNRMLPGLGLKSHQIVSIPGNHDKLLQTDLELYGESFVKPLGLDQQIEPRRSVFVHRRVAGRDFLFMLVDASVYGASRLTVNFRARHHLACGEVTESLATELVDKIQRLRMKQVVDGISLDDFSGTFKILVVHYAVDVETVLQGRANPSLYILPHGCVGLDSVVARLAENLDLVVHGHLHVPSVYNVGGVPIIAVGTVSQKGSPTHGFFLLKFARSGQVYAEHHIWRGHGFKKDADPALTRTVN